jgi:hypothetical protein
MHSDVHGPAPLRLALMIFVVIAVGLMVLAWPTIRAAGFEGGDFAANSILIQDAKGLALFHGNYSRVGFNHPGPAILYVLMLGEVFFADLLGLVAPVGGQLAAVAIYNAAWMAVVFVMLARLFGGVTYGLVGLAAFVGASAHLIPTAFTGLWFPDLYYFPFAAFVAALAVAIRGDAWSLPSLAVSAGFLVNGHVSFVSTVGVMLATGLLANVALRLAGALPERHVWSAGFLRANLRRILLAGLLGAAFLVPLLIDTVINPPGQIPRYMNFASANAGAGMGASARFLLTYLGSATATAALALALLAISMAAARSGALAAGAPYALMAALAAATVATFVYASNGIDDLSYKYVALYYYTVPAFALATAAACLAALTAGRARLALGVAFGVLVLGVSLRQVAKPVPYVSFYSNPTVPQTYQELTALGPDLALDLDTTRNWDLVWSTVASLQAYAARRGEKPFCVARNWHILFTQAYRCTPEQLARSRRLLLTTAAPRLAGVTLLAEHGGVAFYEDAGLLLQLGTPLRIGDGPALPISFLHEGWSSVEIDFVWSSGPQATLAFRSETEPRRLVLDTAAFTPGRHVQRVEVTLNGTLIGTLVFEPGQGRVQHTLELPPGTGREHRLVMHIRTPLSPRAAGVSADPRALGVALYGLVLE